MNVKEQYTDFGFFPGVSSEAHGYAQQARESAQNAATKVGNAVAAGIPNDITLRIIARWARAATALAECARGHAEQAAALVLGERPTLAWETHVASAKRCAVLAAKFSVRIGRRAL